MSTVSVIPLRNDIFNYKFRISLSGTIFTIEVKYNYRIDRWFLDISNIAEDPILSGVPLLINRDLLGQYTTLNVIQGSLLVLDSSQRFIQPTQFSFGGNNFLVYVA